MSNKRYWLVFELAGKHGLSNGPLLGVYPEMLYLTSEIVKVPGCDCSATVVTELTAEQQTMFDTLENKRLGFSAEQLLATYPDNDLTVVDAPLKGESVTSWTDRCAESIADCGDSMLKFIIYEAGDLCESKTEFIARMEKGVKQLEEVIRSIEHIDEMDEPTLE